MKLWVYIYEYNKGCLKTALATSVENIIASRQIAIKIVYLRPFELPFDAIAHKYLLDYLSKDSVMNWFNNHKEETKKWLDLIFRNDCETD